jgi:aspartate carbamoyltransferase catalytic subunit
MRHILRADQFDRAFFEQIYRRASVFDSVLKSKDFDQIAALRGIFPNRKLYNIFMEDSTRTDLSFRDAAINLGMDVVPAVGVHLSSANKGEGLIHTFKTIGAYRPDVLVLRHPEAHAPEKVAKLNLMPIINAGDGANEHPTQTHVDMFTFRHFMGGIDGKTIVFGGDCKFGRTIRSAAQAVSLYDDVTLIFVAPPRLQIRKDIQAILRARDTKFELTDDLEYAIAQADFFYASRIQLERLTKKLRARYHELAMQFQITPELMKMMKEAAYLGHPLPIVNQAEHPDLIAEIDPAVDEDPRAIYFQQAGFGVPVRMALIEWVLSKD